ncbi:MAG: DNA-binding domain-containing protein [Candidatus Thiodiazotropha sp.]
MKRLTQLQNSFQSFILSPDDTQQQTWVNDQGHVSAGTRLNVYAHAYRARLIEVLANDYPAVAAAIGEHRFRHLAESYIQRYPSSYFSLRNFGNRFPTHVADNRQRPQDEQTVGWLYELALFELRLGQAFDAPDHTPINEQEVAQIPAERWPSLKLEFMPSLSTMALEWNTPALWKNLTSEQPVAMKAVHGETSPWLIWRQDLLTRFRSLDQDERILLDGLQRGANFNEACMLMTALLNEEAVAMRAAGLLKSWLNQDMIAGIYYS